MYFYVVIIFIKDLHLLLSCFQALCLFYGGSCCLKVKMLFDQENNHDGASLLHRYKWYFPIKIMPLLFRAGTYLCTKFCCMSLCCMTHPNCCNGHFNNYTCNSILCRSQAPRIQWGLFLGKCRGFQP